MCSGRLALIAARILLSAAISEDAHDDCVGPVDVNVDDLGAKGMLQHTQRQGSSILADVFTDVEEEIRTTASSQKQWQTKSVPQSEDKTFDITINSFKRDRFLEDSLKGYIQCHPKHGGGRQSALSHIWVMWNDNKRAIPHFIKRFEESGIVTFFTPTGEDRISNRFLPLKFTSNAVFHVDDDSKHGCATLHDMFELWRTDTDSMVGTSPRKLDLLQGGQECWACALIWGEYNLVYLTKGAFVHKRFFDEYWKPFWKPIRDKMDEHQCGEDVLMSAVHASVVGKGKAFAVAGSVNKGEYMVRDLQYVEELQDPKAIGGLNTRTWGIRGFAIGNISEFLTHNFPKEADQGHFSHMTKQWWRSNSNVFQSCRDQAVACYNRAWDSCSEECDVQVRGNMACFTGNSACYAGSHFGTKFDTENEVVLCVGKECSM